MKQTNTKILQIIFDGFGSSYKHNNKNLVQYK